MLPYVHLYSMPPAPHLYSIYLDPSFLLLNRYRHDNFFYMNVSLHVSFHKYQQQCRFFQVQRLYQYTIYKPVMIRYRSFVALRRDYR